MNISVSISLALMVKAIKLIHLITIVDGNDGTEPGVCGNRGESAKLDDKTKSLVLVNHFGSAPFKQLSCVENSEDLIDMLNTCYGQAGNRWANFVAVNYYKVCNSFLLSDAI